LDHFTLQYNPDGAGWRDWLSILLPSIHQAWFVGGFGHQYAFRLNATDRSGNVSAFSGANTTIKVTCQKDSYEDGAGDNIQANAKPILVGTGQSHNFCGTGDSDWVTFTAVAGKSYLIFARPGTGSPAAPVLSLYTSSGTPVNGLHQANPTGLAQGGVILWTAPASGTYAVNAHSLDPAVAGTGVTYLLTVAENYPVILPVIVSNSSFH